MKKSHRVITSVALAIASLGVSIGAQAQSNTANSSNTMSAYTPGNAYVELGIGKSDYSLSNGIGIFGAEQGDSSYSIRGGSYFNNNLGMELGYSDLGRINRAGGTTSADVLSVSLIGKLPLSPSFNLLGKVGTTWSRTKVSSALNSGVVAGDDGGFGLSYGVGGEFAFNPQWSAALEYESYNLKFPGDRTERVGNTTLSARYHF